MEKGLRPEGRECRTGDDRKLREFIVKPQEAGLRLDRYLFRILDRASKGFVYKMMRKKNIVLNGRKADGNEILQENDQVRIYFSEETFWKFSTWDIRAEGEACLQREGGERQGTAFAAGLKNPDSVPVPGEGGASPENSGAAEKTGGKMKTIAADTGRRNSGAGIPEAPMPEILYEDEDILVLSKPAGMLSQKASAGDYSANDFVIDYLLESGQLCEQDLVTFRPSICNRLDRNTSGLLIAGKTTRGLQRINGQLRDRSVRKFYHCLVLGELAEEGLREGYLCKDEKTNTVRVSADPDELCRENSHTSGGKAVSRIETAWKPLKAENGMTFLEVHLITGKTHQIRAQLAAEGHPILGDPKYGDREANRKLKREFGVDAQLLHACRMEFPEGTVFSAPDPEIFSRVFREFSFQKK